jgi:putative DNA primase/helicase
MSKASKVKASKVEAPKTKAAGTVDAAIQADDDKAEIKRLASLSPLEYERERKAAAEKLGIERLAILDNLIRHERRDASGTKGQGKAIDLPPVEPWPESANGAELLTETAAAILRYMVMPDGAAEIVALWAAHTHCFECFAVTPRLAITSPEKQCGKTTLLDILTCLVARPLSTANTSTAAVFRVIEVMRPTLLVDEADTFLKENDELRGVLNAGHRKGGAVIRTVGEDHEPRQFSVWAPVAIAMIGRLPDTLHDRSTDCRLRRRKPSERVQSFRSDRTDHLLVLARKMARWTSDNAVTLAAADPDMGSLQNRVADNWRPLFALADLAGGKWPTRVREIAAGADAARAEQSVGVLLLADCRAAFTEKGERELSGEDLVAYLTGLEHRPWPESNRGKPLTKARLARMLGKFEIWSTDIRFPGKGVLKGYLLPAFEEAFAAYLPPENATTQQAHSHSDNLHFQNATEQHSVALSKAQQAYSHSDCRGIALSKGGEGQKGEQSGVPMRSDAPSLARPKAANGQALRPPTPPADATASLGAPVEETALSPSSVPDPASDPPKETGASSPTLASPDLDDIPAFLDRRPKSALADASAP